MGLSSQYRYIVITGRPGVGKTTLFNKVIEILKSQNIRVGGFTCPEVREGGVRVGFRIRSLDGKYEGWLAHKTLCSGPRLGKYRLCVDEAADVATRAVEDAIREADVIAIDEIGPMELRIPQVRNSILKALKSGKPGLFVAHMRLSDVEILPLLKNYGIWFTVTIENRNTLLDDIINSFKNIVNPTKT